MSRYRWQGGHVHTISIHATDNASVQDRISRPSAIQATLVGYELLPGFGRLHQRSRIPSDAPAKATPTTLDPDSYVNFSEPDANEYIVRDINPGDRYRWTRDHPELKFWVRRQPGLRFSMSFWIATATLRDTGPVTVTVKINGNLLGSIHCNQARNYRFDRPVPLEWVRPGEPVLVLAESSPLWTAPGDGANLGYLLEGAGFRWPEK